jgi:hypothetical protein
MIEKGLLKQPRGAGKVEEELAEAVDAMDVDVEGDAELEEALQKTTGLAGEWVMMDDGYVSCLFLVPLLTPFSAQYVARVRPKFRLQCPVCRKDLSMNVGPYHHIENCRKDEAKKAKGGGVERQE